MAYNGIANTYEFENGRRYHGYRGGAYMYPNDEREQDRLDIFHKIFLVARHEELHRAPITPNNYGPTRILDLGTGTGIWAIGMADTYRDAEVIGTDLSLIQPKWIPRNLRFQVADFESEWTLGKSSFDLIHLRNGAGSVSSWPTLFSRVFQHLKPGYGWFEYVDIDMEARSDDGTLTRHHALSRWQQYVMDATAAAGKPMAYEHRTGQLLRDAGFTDIQEVVYQLPLSPWPAETHLKDCGRWYNLGMSEGLEAFSLGPLCRVLKWPQDEVRNFLKDVQKDINSKQIHAYSNIHIWIARRPASMSPPPPPPPHH
ncbi:S-adenosyl-L-methionine-dependent methyltransferase [Tricharina praecox]|uniref:S-adenosyl-L-methionine-dependent methyltransferase n=1 Tax=Tricharina praecox TaxID=43433 RepID=UPI0022206ACA|nr:S-adenosyl-L-methionine-dependent methyltransferase [Tricharina praecox]KAI5850719.1 S-adenosyl-L-methionine-dependent methyltransferase [Tricharina praecox]